MLPYTTYVSYVWNLWCCYRGNLLDINCDISIQCNESNGNLRVMKKHMQSVGQTKRENAEGEHVR